MYEMGRASGTPHFRLRAPTLAGHGCRLAGMSVEATSTAVLRMTEEEFLARYADERPSYEFVNGEVTQKPMTKRSHFLVAGEIAAALREYRRAGARGLSGEDPTVNISVGADRRYRAPDVAYWSPAKAGRAEILGPPTLAVEVLSPGQTLSMMRAKCREYRSRGVEACWLINPNRRTAEVFDEARDGEPLTEGLLECGALPGFRLPLAELFAPLDE
jgi:Uma2 family endonuclease